MYLSDRPPPAETETNAFAHAQLTILVTRRSSGVFHKR